jgi:hypothetical protein
MFNYLAAMLNDQFSQEKPQSNRRRRFRRLQTAEIDQILREYQDPEQTLRAIAEEHGVSVFRVTWLARRGGLQLRGRGRKASTAPSARHLEILEAVREATMAEVGSRYGCSKQRVFQVVDRWRDWMARDECPAPMPDSEPEHRAQLQKKPARELIISFRLASSEADALLSVLDCMGLRRAMSLGGHYP